MQAFREDTLGLAIHYSTGINPRLNSWKSDKSDSLREPEGLPRTERGLLIYGSATQSGIYFARWSGRDQGDGKTRIVQLDNDDPTMFLQNEMSRFPAVQVGWFFRSVP